MLVGSICSVCFFLQNLGDGLALRSRQMLLTQVFRWRIPAKLRLTGYVHDECDVTSHERVIKTETVRQTKTPQHCFSAYL